MDECLQGQVCQRVYSLLYTRSDQKLSSSPVTREDDKTITAVPDANLKVGATMQPSLWWKMST